MDLCAVAVGFLSLALLLRLLRDLSPLARDGPPDGALAAVADGTAAARLLELVAGAALTLAPTPTDAGTTGMYAGNDAAGAAEKRDGLRATPDVVVVDDDDDEEASCTGDISMSSSMLE